MNQKFLPLLLAAILLISACPLTALAGIIDGEITFQNIPWQSSFETVRSALTKEGLVSGNMQKFTDMGYYLKPFKKSVGTTSEVKGRMEATFKTQKPIAGYDTTYVSMTFASSEDHTQLVYARVSFECPNLEEAFYDLETKLKSIYGETKRTSKKVNNLPCKECVWFGENDTALWLYLYSDEDLTLHYGTLKAGEIIESLPKQSNHVDPTNTYGL